MVTGVQTCALPIFSITAAAFSFPPESARQQALPFSSFIGWELLCVLPMLAGFSWVVAAFSDAAAMGVALVTLLAVPLSAGFFVVRPYEEAAWAVFYRDITAAEAETE